MDRWTGFLCAGRTSEGHPLAVAGLIRGKVSCEDGNLLNAVHAFSTRKSKDGYLLDFLLTNFLRIHLPPGTVAAGASLWVPGAESGGGVVGDPFAPAQSADGELVLQENGVWNLAYPGRWGAALCTDHRTAAEISAALCKSGSASGQQLERILSKKASAYILVTDGCGESSSGYVAVCAEGRRQSVWLKTLLTRKTREFEMFSRCTLD